MNFTTQQHCNHECVCAVLAIDKNDDGESPCDFSGCKFDTRIIPSPQPKKYLITEDELNDAEAFGLQPDCPLIKTIRSRQVSSHTYQEYECWKSCPKITEHHAAIRNATLKEILPTHEELKALKSVVCNAISNRTDGYKIADDYYHKLKTISYTVEVCPHWIKIEHSDGDEWCCNRPSQKEP